MFEAARSQCRDDLWAITCYFNPLGYRRRLTNYRVFRRHFPVPLVAVELGYTLDFELTRDDADVLVQLRGTDVLWQKERLLNLALRFVPSRCRKIIWIDCDLIFEASHWAERTSLLLDQFELVQPFSRLHRMAKSSRPGQGPPEGSTVWRAIPSLIGSGICPRSCLSARSEEAGAAPGYAWAGRREILEEHQFYDACIIGGGDSAMLRAAYGCFDDVIRRQRMSRRQREHYMTWAGPFYQRVGAKVGFVEGDILHLWHGSAENRRYHERWHGLARFDFDPFIDIATDQNGAWRWNSDKAPMHTYVREYFASRREDG
jgi:hypothetical protein